MIRLLSLPAVALFIALFPFVLVAQPAADAADAVSATLDQRTLDKRTAPILKDLKLGDSALETRVRAVLAPHFQALTAWHAANDAALKSLWTAWAEARSTGNKDEAAAAKVGEKIDAVYATFRPQHDAFLTALATQLSPAQVIAVKDSLTKSPGLQRTYDAYLEMVPRFTDADKAFIREKLTVAREQAMDALTNKEKAELFKRQKIQVQTYMNEHGYDYEKSYVAWIEKNKATTAKPAAK